MVQNLVRKQKAKKELKKLKIEAKSVTKQRELNKGLENKIISLQQRLTGWLLLFLLFLILYLLLMLCCFVSLISSPAYTAISRGQGGEQGAEGEGGEGSRIGCRGEFPDILIPTSCVQVTKLKHSEEEGKARGTRVKELEEELRQVKSELQLEKEEKVDLVTEKVLILHIL